MSWKAYVLSGAAFLATYIASIPPSPSRQAEPAPLPRSGDRSRAEVNLLEQADRLQAHISATAYRQPTRDAFHFSAATRRSRALAPLHTPGAPSPAIAVPATPPFLLVGIAADDSEGTTRRTAILSTQRGVSLVKEGDVVEGGYRVAAIDENAMTLEATSDGTRTTLPLSGSGPTP